MSLLIKIYTTKNSELHEVECILHFCIWQKFKVYHIFELDLVKVLTKTKGKSNIVIEVYRKEEIIKSFYNFHQLYQWSNEAGLLLC